MNQQERDRLDQLESDGTLERLRQHVMSFCAPLWWESAGEMVLHNGSMCVIATSEALFGVTNDHVLGIYEKDRAKYPDVFCQLGSGPFEPTEHLISRSRYWDLATFRLPVLTLEHWGRQVYRPASWPPEPIKKNDSVILGGYPENRRSASSPPKPKTLLTDFVTFWSRADNWSYEHMSFSFDSTGWYWPQATELPAHPDLSGMSGGPCFRLSAARNEIELAGFIYEAHGEYEVIRVRQASLISSTGEIAPPPIGVPCR